MTIGPFGPLPPPLGRPVTHRLQGPRLLLRRYELDDAAALGALVAANIEHLAPYMEWITLEPRSTEERAAFLAEQRHEGDLGRDGIYGCFLDDELIGSCGLHRRRPDAEVLEVGYWLGAAFTGFGYATELTLLLCEEAFDHQEITRVELYCDDRNTRSAAVAERSGFLLVETTDDVRGVQGRDGSGRERRYVLRRDAFDPAWRARF